MCRDEIAECSEHAYTTLPLADAGKLMLFQSDQEAAAYAEDVSSPQLNWTNIVMRFSEARQHLHCYSTMPSCFGLCPTMCACNSRLERLLVGCVQHGWNVRDGTIYFSQAEEKNAAESLQSVGLIENALSYAREIERIV